MTKKIICRPGHHENILESRQINRGSELRLAVQFADTKSLHRSDEQSRRENSADAGSINFLSWLQIRLF